MTTMTRPAEAAVTAEDALKIIASAAGGIACPVHEVGPVANHITGPLSALRPVGHADHAQQKSGAKRAKATVDRLILDATSQDTIRCTCEDEFRHPLAVVITKVSEGAFIRMHLNSTASQRDLDRALSSADVDLLTHYAEPRLDVLKGLVDRVRTEHGGTLPAPVITAVLPLVQSLAGPTRWDVRNGYHDGWPWSINWRPGAVFDKADAFMSHPVAYDAVLRRILKGSL